MFGLSIAKLLIYAAIAAAFVSFGAFVAYKPAYNRGEAEGVKLTTAKYEAALKQQKIDAETMYQMALKRNVDLEKENATLHVTQKGLTDELTQANVAVRDRIAKSGSLRDPGATAGRGGCGPSAGQTKSAGAGVGQVVPTETSGVLSEQATRFLRSLVFDADSDAQVARECKVYSDEVQRR